MESLKQEMLHHEFIFRNQVRELHRLYWTQKNLMNEFRLKMFDSHALIFPSLVGTTGSTNLEDNKNGFLVPFQTAKTWNSLSESVDLKGQSSMKIHDIDFSLHLPADDFIRGKGKGLAFCHPGTKTVNGSLGEIITENGICHSARKGKEVIDLEDSVELENYEGTDVAAFSVGFRAPFLLDADLFGTKMNVPYGHIHQMPSVIRLTEENDGRLQEQKHDLQYVGFEDSCMVTSVNEPRKKQQASPMLFDLNMPPEHVDQSDNCGLQTSNTSAEPSYQNRVDSSLDSKQGNDNLDSIHDNLQSTPHCDIDIKRQDSNVTSSNSTNDLLQTTINRDLLTEPVNHEGSEEDTSSSHEGQALYACSRKDVCKTMERSADNSVTTQLSSPQNEVFYTGEASASTAAEILMSISSRCSPIPIENLGALPASNDPSNRDVLPKYSFDSYEFLTMQLSEVRSENQCSMVELSSETGKNVRGHRLRRGRGFRDFQKEILPGLVTLSRHEIREDLQYIGYKRRRVVITNARDSWSVPVRSRRSNLPCGHRRR